MKKITMGSSDADKIECLRITTEILSKTIVEMKVQKDIEELKARLRTKCREIEAKAGEPWKINADFDLEKEGADIL